MKQPPSLITTTIGLTLLLGCAAPVDPILRPGLPSPPSDPVRAAAPAPTVGKGPLAPLLDPLLEDPGFSQAIWGIHIQQVRGGRVLYERHPDLLFMPASNMKLPTTAAALLQLGPRTRPVTTLFAAGEISEGRLQGDLVLVGGGDPSLGGRFAQMDPLRGMGDPWPVMRALADSVRGAGITTIGGDLVGFDALFAHEPLGAGWPWDGLVYGYSAPVSALTWNEAVVRVVVEPADVIGAPARVRLEPDVGVMQLEARVATGGPLSRRSVSLSREPGSDRLIVVGTVPVGSARSTSEAAVPDPTLFAILGLRKALGEAGVTIEGTTRAEGGRGGTASGFRIETGVGLVVPQGARQLAAWPGPTIAELVRVTNKVSQNLYAETLLRLVPALREGTGSVQTGRREVESTLTGLGIAPGRYVQRDGSGLSRYNYLSAQVISRLLRGMDRSRVREAWHDSLPVMGGDGTLSERGGNTPIAGQVWAKTGSISNTRTLSGYLVTAGGDTLTFALLANNFTDPNRSVEYVQDLICELLVTGAAVDPPPRQKILP